MTDIPQPVNVTRRPLPTSPTRSSRDHGLRINVDVNDQAPPSEVSPLTPHASQVPNQQDEQPVSPIESSAPARARAPLPERSFQSQIPRKVSKPDDKPRTKWDEYSGEPTHDGRGKESSVQPGTQPVETQYPHLKERTKQILAGLREREGAKKTPWGKPPPPVADDPLDNPPQREPWRGASGRAAIVEPVKNTPSARTGPLPHADNINHMKAFQSPEARQYESSPAGQTIRTKPSEESIKPVVPLKTRNLTPPLTGNTPLQSPTKRSLMDSPEPILAPPAEITERPRVESPQYDPEPTTPTTPIPGSLHGDEFAEPSSSFVSPGMGQEQSRFSWTTYATSTESPRSMGQVTRDSSPPPPMPGLPPPSITIKKRPVSSSPFMHSQPYMQPSFADSNSSVVRKPLPGLQPRSSSISTASRAMSTSKTLPPTPTIAEAADKIESLNAQLESLDRRKQNINRIVADLEASLKKNAVVYDMWKRREVEKNILNHKMELDDIGREVYEISLQLHRAQRKRDREDSYEAPTGLWIKRVTS